MAPVPQLVRMPVAEAAGRRLPLAAEEEAAARELLPLEAEAAAEAGPSRPPAAEANGRRAAGAEAARPAGAAAAEAGPTWWLRWFCELRRVAWRVAGRFPAHVEVGGQIEPFSCPRKSPSF